MPVIHFLTYMNRSGSTLLARELDGYRDVAVSLEADLVDGFKRGTLDVRSEDDLCAFLDALFRDEKLRAWNLDLGAVRGRLSSGPFPLRFKTMLAALLGEYFRDDPAEIYLYKSGRYYNHTGCLRKEFPGARFVFVDRDPRAIYNSQRRTLDSRRSEPMRTDGVRFVKSYKRTQRVVRGLEGEPWFLRVRYENLVNDRGKEIRRVLDFLGASDAEGQGSYYSRIPAQQKPLHEHLAGDELEPERIEAWHEELPPIELWFLQKVLQEELVANGYRIQAVPDLKVRELLRLLPLFWRYWRQVVFTGWARKWLR